MKRPKLAFVLGFISGNLFLCVLVVVVLHVLAQSSKKTPEEISELLRVPPIPMALDADYQLGLKTLEGQPFDFTSLRGNAVFLTFINPDCTSCLGELAAVERLFENAGDSVKFVIAATSGSVDEIQQTVGRFNLTMPVYKVDEERPEFYRTPVLPTTFILSPDGKLAFKQVGLAKWDDDSVVKYLLNLSSPVEKKS